MIFKDYDKELSYAYFANHIRFTNVFFKFFEKKHNKFVLLCDLDTTLEISDFKYELSSDEYDEIIEYTYSEDNSDYSKSHVGFGNNSDHSFTEFIKKISYFIDQSNEYSALFNKNIIEQYVISNLNGITLKDPMIEVGTIFEESKFFLDRKFSETGSFLSFEQNEFNFLFKTFLDDNSFSNSTYGNLPRIDIVNVKKNISKNSSIVFNNTYLVNYFNKECELLTDILSKSLNSIKSLDNQTTKKFNIIKNDKLDLKVAKNLIKSTKPVLRYIKNYYSNLNNSNIQYFIRRRIDLLEIVALFLQQKLPNQNFKSKITELNKSLVEVIKKIQIIVANMLKELKTKEKTIELKNIFHNKVFPFIVNDTESDKVKKIKKEGFKRLISMDKNCIYSPDIISQSIYGKEPKSFRNMLLNQIVEKRSNVFEEVSEEVLLNNKKILNKKETERNEIVEAKRLEIKDFNDISSSLFEDMLNNSVSDYTSIENHFNSDVFTQKIIDLSVIKKRNGLTKENFKSIPLQIIKHRSKKC